MLGPSHLILSYILTDIHRIFATRASGHLIVYQASTDRWALERPAGTYLWLSLGTHNRSTAANTAVVAAELLMVEAAMTCAAANATHADVGIFIGILDAHLFRLPCIVRRLHASMVVPERLRPLVVGTTALWVDSAQKNSSGTDYAAARLVEFLSHHSLRALLCPFSTRIIASTFNYSGFGHMFRNAIQHHFHLGTVDESHHIWRLFKQGKIYKLTLNFMLLFSRQLLQTRYVYVVDEEWSLALLPPLRQPASPFETMLAHAFEVLADRNVTSGAYTVEKCMRQCRSCRTQMPAQGSWAFETGLFDIHRLYHAIARTPLSVESATLQTEDLYNVWSRRQSHLKMHHAAIGAVAVCRVPLSLRQPIEGCSGQVLRAEYGTCRRPPGPRPNHNYDRCQMAPPFNDTCYQGDCPEYTM